MRHDRIAVVDFGGQYAHLIANKIRRLHVLAEIRQPDDPAEAFSEYRGVVLSGSPALGSRGDAGATSEMMELPVPILGLCFGHQEIARHAGGSIEHAAGEYGPAELEIGDSPLFEGLPERIVAWMSHGDAVTRLPAGFRETGRSFDCRGEVRRNAAIENSEARRYGLQFHPEVDDTEFGEKILENFAVGICGCSPTWSLLDFVEEQTDEIRRRVGGRSVLLLASGGVDSTVCAKLLGEALHPSQLHLLHVDNGFMRKNESAEVVEELETLGLGENLRFVDASAEFLSAVSGLLDPEEKRRAIGDAFVRVFDRETEKIGRPGMLLGQGTIYPDTIESGGTKRSDVIKTHHNRVPSVEKMIADGRVVEPIRDLYKSEVREVGESLGIADRIVWRHPFPGPGLGIRCLCSDGTLPPGFDPAAEHLVEQQLEGTGMRGSVLPIRSVGVKGDLRSYEHPVLLWGEAPRERLDTLSSRLCSKVPGVNRCLLDLTGRGGWLYKLVEARVTRERLDLLREADSIVSEALRRHGLERAIWQCPGAIAPLEIDGMGRELVMIRPVLSERAMTAKPAMLPESMIGEILHEIMSLSADVSGVALDVTTKPPATIEFE